MPSHYLANFFLTQGLWQGWSGLGVPRVRRGVEGPLLVKLVVSSDLHLGWQLKPAEAVEVARALLPRGMRGCQTPSALQAPPMFVGLWMGG